jgi:Mrp family chromosome partitioning ATPase
VDGVLLVAASGEARRAGLKYTKEQLSRARGRLVGLAVNKANASGGRRYPHYPGYYEEGRRRLADGEGSAQDAGGVSVATVPTLGSGSVPMKDPGQA